MPAGYVKLKDETNDQYIASFGKEWRRWTGVIRRTHKKLTKLDPNYQISQIKSKFGELRWYFDSNADKVVQAKMQTVIFDAERKVERMERDREVWNYWRRAVNGD